MITKIIINEDLTQELKDTLGQLQRDHQGKVEGIYEIYDGLYLSGHCDSYNKARAYYVAYTLAIKNIDFVIE